MTELTQSDVTLTSAVGGTRRMPIRVIFQASAHWDDDEAIEETMTRVFNRFHALPHSDLILVHATNGAALIASTKWLELGGTVEPHETDWDGWGANAAYVRNAKMVNAGADLVLLFISSMAVDHELRALTRLSDQTGIPTLVVNATSV